MAFPAGSHATPVEVLHLAAWIDMVDLLAQERLGEARVVWGLVVETLLLWNIPGMDEGWIIPELPDLYSVPCQAVLVQAASVDSLPERWQPRCAVKGAWSLQVRGEDLLPSHVRRLLARLRLGQDGVSVVEIFELWKDWQGRPRTWEEPWFSADAIDRGNHLGWRAGHSWRLLLGAVEANVDYIPPMCRLCGVPTLDTCDTCEAECCRACDLCQAPELETDQ